MQKVSIPSVFVMPDCEGRLGAIYSLAPSARLAGWKFLLAVVAGGSIGLAICLLRMAWIAAQIPYPGR